MASQSTYLAYVFTKTPHMNQRPSKSPVSYQDTLFSPGITFTFVPPPQQTQRPDRVYTIGPYHFEALHP